MVNQTSLTGESAPVRKAEGSFAYAGTVLEEGELTVKVKEAAGSSRYEKIVNMIEDSEKLKSSVESNAEHLADRLVPYTLAGTGITSAYQKHDENPCGTYGRFLLRTEACHACFRIIRYT